MSNYPPGVSDRDFADEGEYEYSALEQLEEPPVCGVCGQEDGFMRSNIDGRWFGVQCAAMAGNPQAKAMWAEAREILEQGYKEHHEKLEREARELATVTNEKHDQEAA